MYKDGNEIASDTNSLTLVTGIVTIGYDFDYEEFSSAYIDEVRMYNRALSGGEVKSIYESTK
ncbi:MAG: hypothetical protein PHS16_02975 [Candidatus Colwellbacteria bacterium]|nr:hypothetical protein [Candidatus Colwellbacteria bacterium]